MAGPYCTMMLGDLGADVVKVERPGEGDDTRQWAPPYQGEESVYFLSVNRNKRSLTLDLQRPEGAEVLARLLRTADVLVENFRPGVLDRLGFSEARLRELNPRLISCSVSGFGPTGPRAEEPAFDQVVQGIGGIMSLTGHPGGEPTRVGVPIADLAAGLYAAVGVLGALIGRAGDGQGARVETSLLGALVGLLSFQAAGYFSSGVAPGPVGNAHPSIAPYELFHAADGALNLAAANQTLWLKLCAALDLPDLPADPRFATVRDRTANRAALHDLIEARLRGLTVAEAIERLRAAGVPCGPVNDLAGTFADPQVVHLGLRAAIPDPTRPGLEVVGSPLRVGDDPPRLEPPPHLGEHTDAILADLGYTPDQVAALRAAGVV